MVGLSFLANMLGDVDLATLDVDRPLPPLADTNASKSRLAMIRRMGLDEHHTIREVYTRLAPARGHLTLIGAAEQVADTLCEWHADAAADGFMLVPGLMPQAQTDFDRMVLPILRERGVARSDYAGRTLRDHLGLATPANRLSRPSRAMP